MKVLQKDTSEKGSNPEEEGAGSYSLFVCWLFDVPATGQCISATDLLRQFDVLPH